MYSWKEMDRWSVIFLLIHRVAELNSAMLINWRKGIINNQCASRFTISNTLFFLFNTTITTFLWWDDHYVGLGMQR